MAMFYLFVCVFCSFYGCHTYCLMLLVFTFMPDLFCECWLIYMFLMCFNVFRPWSPCYYGLLLHRFLALVFFLRLPWWLSSLYFCFIAIYWVFLLPFWCPHLFSYLDLVSVFRFICVPFLFYYCLFIILFLLVCLNLVLATFLEFGWPKFVLRFFCICINTWWFSGSCCFPSSFVCFVAHFSWCPPILCPFYWVLPILTLVFAT